MRDAWHTIGQVNLQSEAIRLFNLDKLPVTNPATGAAFETLAHSDITDESQLLSKLHATKLSVLGIDPHGTSLVIPADDVLPVRVDGALAVVLQNLREAFPPPAKRLKVDPDMKPPEEPPKSTTVSEDDFSKLYTMLKAIDHDGGWRSFVFCQ